MGRGNCDNDENLLVLDGTDLADDFGKYATNGLFKTKHS